jgi:hypothetical protein
MELDIYIDSVTNCLVLQETGEEFDTEYRLVTRTITKADALAMKREGWKFDWSIPHKNGYDVYELLILGEETIQGRIALKHIRDQYYTHVDIVEAAPHNIGKNGRYKGVGAHLFAIACKLSWDAGNEGYVQFTAKTDLVEHYMKTLDAHNIDWHTMYIDSYGAVKLIKKYFKDGA